MKNIKVWVFVCVVGVYWQHVCVCVFVLVCVLTVCSGCAASRSKLTNCQPISKEAEHHDASLVKL